MQQVHYFLHQDILQTIMHIQRWNVRHQNKFISDKRKMWKMSQFQNFKFSKRLTT